MGASLGSDAPRTPAATSHHRWRYGRTGGLDCEDFAWIMNDCDPPVDKIAAKGRSRALDPKGFWRAEKQVDPEHRHPVLAQIAFHEVRTAGLGSVPVA